MPCWNPSKYLVSLTQKCIASLRDTTDAPLIIIEDGEFEGNEFLKFEADIYIKNKENLGWTHAVNQGIQATDSEYIAICGTDHSFDSPWLNECIKEFKDPTVATVSPDTNNEFKDGEIHEIMVASACWVLSREAFNKIGLMDDSMHSRYSDFDYGIRIKDLGLKSIITADCNCWHLGNSTFKSLTHDHNKGLHDKDYLVYLNKWKDHPTVGYKIREILESCSRL